MLKYRPHHFLCSVGFAGKGYSDEFTRNMTKIVDSLRATGGDATEIEVTRTADVLCMPCPHRRGEGCETAEKIEALDEAHAQALGLNAGDVLTWGAAQERIIQKITIEKHHEICAPCSWLASGMCEKALIRLRERHS
jgi:hypothetical protein